MSIEKQNDKEPKKSLRQHLRPSKSLNHVLIFDQDIDWGRIEGRHVRRGLTVLLRYPKIGKISRSLDKDVLKKGSRSRDHASSYPCVQSLAAHTDGNIGIITFDSHLDMYYEPEFTAASQWARLLELPNVDPSNYCSISIRGIRNQLHQDLTTLSH